jgi:hypothetical protein
MVMGQTYLITGGAGNLAATIYHLLGVDPHMQVYDRLGRPQSLCEGKAIEALLG